jgi:hypothetical protein
MRSPWLPLAVCALLLLAGGAHADDRLSPRATGLAGSGASVVRGLDAIGINPALLGDGYAWEFTLYPIGGFFVPVFGIGTPAQTSFERADLDILVTRLAIVVAPSVDRDRIVNGINLPGTTLGVEQGIVSVAHPLGGGLAMALHACQRAYGTYRLDGRVDTVLHQTARSGNVFPIFLRNPASAEGLWYNEYGATLSYEHRSRGVLEFAVGGTLKYLRGLGYASVDVQRLSTISLGSVPDIGPALQVAVDYSVRTSQRTAFDASMLPLSMFYTMFPPSSGGGAGIDLGIARDIAIEGGKVTGAVAITDLGFISWSNPGERTVHRIDTINFSSAVYPIDSLRAFSGTLRLADPFTSALPARLHLSVAMGDTAARGIMPRVVTLQFTLGLVGDLGNSTSPRIAVGAEWPHGWWYAVGGLAYNSDESASMSIGGGIRAFERIWVEASMGRVNGLFESPLLVNAVGRISARF